MCDNDIYNATTSILMKISACPTSPHAPLVNHSSNSATI